ncbi:MAG TPA: replication-relaxation family protein [Anaerolineales bacterium]|jgi:protein involved in plasmid replication-relaxation|nr:replication-relaxation family protein [Anaerolineales bacterium]
MPPETLTHAPAPAKQLPRFRRARPQDRPAFRLTDRDRDLLKIIYDYRFITAEMLQDLAPAVPLTERQQEALAKLRQLIKERKALAPRTDTEERPQRTKREILRRLQVLYHAGFVQRKKLSDRDPIVYSLGNMGHDELTLFHGIDRQQINWTTKNREAGENYIRHTLMVSRFRHAVALALRDIPGVTVAWEPYFKAKVQYEDTLRGKTQLVDGVVIPDGLFVVTDRGKSIHYFLEADRSTMTNARYLTKLKNYFAFYATSVRDNQTPVQRMRVLTLTLSEERKKNLRLTAQAVHETMAKELFWFACERSYLGLPEQVVGPIWQTLKDENLQHW